MFYNKDQATDYIQRNSLEGPIPLRVFEISRKDFQESYKAFSGGAHLSQTTRQEFGDYFSYFVSTKLRDNPYFCELLNPAEGKMFRCFSRVEPVKDSNGNFIYPNFLDYKYSTALDAWNYIQQVGYEMDPTGYLEYPNSAFERMYFPNTYYSSYGYPYLEYLLPLKGANLSFILVYIDEPYDTVESIYQDQINEDPSYRGISYPTLRDLLQGVVIFKWVD